MKYQTPNLTLLDNTAADYEEAKTLAETCYNSITTCLHSLGIDVTPDGYKVSPVNMVFDYVMPEGVSYKSVQDLTKDLGVAVGQEVKVFQRGEKSGVFSVSVVRNNRTYYGIREILEGKEYTSAKSPLTVAAGIGELAEDVVFDLAEAPHLLITGATGTGKTVFLDDIILSIVCKASPAQVKMVLIDPGIDLEVYEGLPHLLFEPLSRKDDVYEAVSYVKELVDKRYEVLLKAGARSIEAYNGSAQNKLPHVVIIIDKYLEFTYEMPQDFEDLIKSIARKGRAAGVHLVINAQSSRSEFVSGEIKANIPYRIAFSVSDWHESKAALDRTGAQRLLGNGDMLLATGADNAPVHIQAPHVSLEEIERVVDDVIKKNGSAKYEFDFDADRPPIEFNLEYIVEILEAISQTRAVDVFFIQKKLMVDYSEASDVIRFLEENSLVSQYNGGKKRTVDLEAVNRMLEEFRYELSSGQ